MASLYVDVGLHLQTGHVRDSHGGDAYLVLIVQHHPKNGETAQGGPGFDPGRLHS